MESMRLVLSKGPPLYLRTVTDPVSETSRVYSKEHWTMGKVKKKKKKEKEQ
jgi:hypothetical protein